MKITRGKKSGLIVRLGREETQVWKRGTPESYELRRRVLRDAEKVVRERDVTGTVEIYAAKSDGGWTADVLHIEDGRLVSRGASSPSAADDKWHADCMQLLGKPRGRHRDGGLTARPGAAREKRE